MFSLVPELQIILLVIKQDQEQAGKDYISEESTETQRIKAVEYMKQHHEELMDMYRQVAQMARDMTEE